MVGLSKAGNPDALEVDLEAAGTQKLLQHVPWDLAVLLAHLADPEDLEDSGAVSVEVSMVAEEVEQGSEVAFRIATALVVDEAASDIREVVGSSPEVGMEAAIAVGILDPMAMELLHPMPQLARVVLEAVASTAVGTTEAATVVQARQIATALLHRLVDMTREEAVAHMMTDPADTVVPVVEVEAMEIGMDHLAVEAAAIWSR